MKKLSFFIPGKPEPKQSKRSRVVWGKDGARIQNYQTSKVKANAAHIKTSISGQLPKDFKIHDGPVMVTKLYYYFAPIRSLRKIQRNIIQRGGWIPKDTKPDVTDNLSKGLFDAVEGVVITNDGRVFSMDNVRKGYHQRPGIYLDMILFDTIEEFLIYQTRAGS